MIKYTNTQIVMAEIPTEVSLAFNISNCQNNCIGCHSPYLRDNVGQLLDAQNLDKKILKDIPYITNILFLGEGNDQEALIEEAVEFKELYNKKISLYSGRTEVEDYLYKIFDYIKVGPYIEKFGPLNNPNTNQRLYKTNNDINKREDITNIFWRKI